MNHMYKPLTLMLSLLALPACDVEDLSDAATDARIAVHEGGQQALVDAEVTDEEDATQSEREELSELELTDHADGVQGPPGMTCCVDCGDGWSGWHNLGTGDNCNSRGAKFCSDNWWYFINAEWRYYC